MPISRFLLFSSKAHSAEPLSLLRRFGATKAIQSRSYVKTPRGNGNGTSRVMNVDAQQNPRSWASYAVPGAILGFASLVAIFHFNDERRAIPKGKGTSSARNTIKGPGGPFTLVNTESETVTEKDFNGKWVLLYFGYTSSPDVGPEQLQILAKAIDKLDSNGVKILPVFVTLDPQRDTPAQLRAYLSEFDLRIIGLTGQVSAVRQMAQEFRVYFKKFEEEGDDYLVDSSHNMYLLSPKMEVVRCFGVEYNSDELSEALLKDMNKFQN